MQPLGFKHCNGTDVVKLFKSRWHMYIPILCLMFYFYVQMTLFTSNSHYFQKLFGFIIKVFLFMNLKTWYKNLFWYSTYHRVKSPKNKILFLSIPSIINIFVNSAKTQSLLSSFLKPSLSQQLNVRLLSADNPEHFCLAETSERLTFTSALRPINNRFLFFLAFFCDGYCVIMSHLCRRGCHSQQV